MWKGIERPTSEHGHGPTPSSQLGSPVHGTRKIESKWDPLNHQRAGGQADGRTAPDYNINLFGSGFTETPVSQKKITGSPAGKLGSLYVAV